MKCFGDVVGLGCWNKIVCGGLKQNCLSKTIILAHYQTKIGLQSYFGIQLTVYIGQWHPTHWKSAGNWYMTTPISHVITALRGCLGGGIFVGKGSLLTLLGIVGLKKLMALSKVRKAILEILLVEHSRIMTQTIWSMDATSQILTAVTWLHCSYRTMAVGNRPWHFLRKF